MNKLDFNILGIYETRWASNMNFIRHTHKMMHAGGDKNESGVGLILGI